MADIVNALQTLNLVKRFPVDPSSVTKGLVDCNMFPDYVERISSTIRLIKMKPKDFSLLTSSAEYASAISLLEAIQGELEVMDELVELIQENKDATSMSEFSTFYSSLCEFPTDLYGFQGNDVRIAYLLDLANAKDRADKAIQHLKRGVLTSPRLPQSYIAVSPKSNVLKLVTAEPKATTLSETDSLLHRPVIKSFRHKTHKRVKMGTLLAPLAPDDGN